MPSAKSLTFLLMDAPYEQARTATAFRLLDAALSFGFGVRVFAYEGAVSLPVTQQKPHANAIAPCSRFPRDTCPSYRSRARPLCARNAGVI